MSIRRLLLTAAVMAGIGLLLLAAAPDWAELALALTHPQRLADTAGPDALVIAAASALAGITWVWGALGLLLTAAGALPGAAGAAGRSLARVVLPGFARRASAVVLGVGIGLNGPLVAGIAAAAPATVTASGPVPDWPAAPAVPAPPSADGSDAPVPDWPASPGSGTHVVLRGECLWTIAAARLRRDAGRSPTDAEIAIAVRGWWQANAGVIGPDPDLLLPGQVLRAPAGP